MDNIYRILKRDFGLRDKHVMVLHALEQQEQKAEDLCKVTHIPQGRIYEYLNTLVESGLVSRSHKKPYLYSVPDFKKNVVWFTKQKIDGMVKAQDELLETLKQPSSNVALINNSAMFSKTHCDIITKARIFRMIGIHHSLPFMLYPEELDEFKALRRVITSSRPTIVQSNGETTLLVYKTYMDAFKKGKSMSGIFEKDTFNRHMQLFERAFEKQQFLAMLDSMIAKIKNYVTYGEVDDATLALLKQKKGESKYYNLNSPRKGYGRKGIKKDFNSGGGLGNRGAAINDLIKRML